MEEGFGKSQAWDAARHIFEILWNWEDGGSLTRWLLFIVVLLVFCGLVAAVALKAVSKLLEVVVKASELYKSSGLPVPMSAEDRQLVRQRAQFCTVLSADLAQLAKFESWNDQWFTDLEAEVESEGGYYPTALSRLLRKPADGLRKEKSLVRALTKSTERAVQLVGEPGAGKSVALRHLAAQIARKGQRSKARKTLVPLYINLREMPTGDLERVTADAIKEFVLDNIRRGDSDTTAFVRDNWAKYRDDGVWFFLFDSFDEIPAVLHAEKGSAAANAYSQAIRQFLEGMGTCKGVLASREFKGPEALAWKKFRILPLNAERQRALVNNAILPARHVQIVLHHLAQGGQLGATPLFLTLLCRHVKLEGKAPTNDHDLLSIHLDRLAGKDADYLQRRYGLQPAQLLIGAEHLARLFAEQSVLGLAPSLDQIAALVDPSELPGRDLQKLLAALVDCKIGRADVPNALQGDRRFAFAHRRYQESLFVRYLVGHPNHLPPRELLSDPRWREYAVTLLQTEPMQSLRSLVSEAISILDVAPSTWTIAVPPVPSECGYFEWSGEQAVYLLELLQEGLARRMEDVPDALRAAVARYLVLRWTAGDTKDQCEVVRLGALLPQVELTTYLTESFGNGTPNAQAAAFKQAPAVRGNAPRALTEAVLRRLSNEILAASDLSKLIQIEALASRLPSSWGAMHVYRRNIFLRRVLGSVRKATRLVFPYRLFALGPELVARRLFPFAAKRQFRESATPLLVLGAGIAMVSGWAVAATARYLGSAKRGTARNYQEPQVGEWTMRFSTLDGMPTLGLILCLLAVCAFVLLLLIYSLRHEGDRLGGKFLFSWAVRTKTWQTLGAVLATLLAMGAVLGIVGWILGSAAYMIYASIDNKPPPLSKGALGALLTISAIYAAGIAVLAFLALRAHRLRQLFAAFQGSYSSELDAIAAFAEIRSLPTVLSHWPSLVRAPHLNRSLASWLGHSLQNSDVTAPQSVKGKDGRPAESIIKTCLEQLESRRDALDDDAAVLSPAQWPTAHRGTSM
ncbi:NACHT domain-containing protein [Variovorax sp. CCNWLW225]|uniref:NACHT domain-containing protein n=1 Tax=Variovorax sp. CCNWLW225 TaxID=3127462 RepID=UPI0030771A4E